MTLGEFDPTKFDLGVVNAGLQRVRWHASRRERSGVFVKDEAGQSFGGDERVGRAELVRLREWRRATLIAVGAVALLAILMLGVVAFDAVDDGQSDVDRSAGWSPSIAQ